MRVNTLMGLGFLLCGLTYVAQGAVAQGGPPGRPGMGGPPRDGAPPTPPAAAYSACEDAEEGDSCQVEMNDRTIDGTCMPDHEDAALVCMPERPGIPPEAFTACESLSAGDACVLTGPDGEEGPEGLCAEGPEGLHCRPADMQPPSR